MSLLLVRLSAVWIVLVVLLSVAGNNVHGFSSPAKSIGHVQKTSMSQQRPQRPVGLVASPKLSSETRHSKLQRPRTETSISTALSLFSFPSIIASSDTWGNWMMLTGAATVAQRLGTATVVGRLLGAPVTAMAMTFVMASIGILPPGGTAASKSLQALSIQLATPLVLLGADFTNCLQRCGPLILSFFVASFGTILGCYVGWTCFGGWLTHSMKRDALKIAAALLAKNVGGGINYVAVCRTLNASPASMAAGLCVDNLMALLYFPLSTALGAGRPDVSANDATTLSTDSTTTAAAAAATPSTLSSLGTVQQITTVISLSALLLWLGERLGGVDASLPCCTLLTVFLANVAHRWIQPLRHTAELLGTTCLYWFFATAGAPGVAVAESVQASLLPLGLYLVSLYGIHAACLYLCYQLFGRRITTTGNQKSPPTTSNKEDGNVLVVEGGWRGFALAQRLLVASSAAIGGPATAVALAQTHGWTQLQVPSILVGNLGYAIATFCGLAFHQLLLVATSSSLS